MAKKSSISKNINNNECLTNREAIAMHNNLNNI